MREWFLYNCAHQHSSIKSSDGSAWIRILGSFCSKELALEHAKKLASIDAGIEIRISPQNEFRVLLRSRYLDTPEKLDMITRERETQKHAFLLDAHSLKRKLAFEETAKNAETRQMGELKYAPEERAKEYKEEFKVIERIEANIVPKAPNVKSIPKDYELRMQRFAAIALIPDYEHSGVNDHLLGEWEKDRDTEFSKIRNKALLSNLKGPMPTNYDLLKEWIVKNPPPLHTNIFGQPLKDSDIWIRNENTTSSDSEVQAWMHTMAIEKEKKLWEMCGAEKPDRSQSLKKWFEENPLPTIHESVGAEPAVSFLKTANSEDELKKWLEQDCKIRNEDVACIAMYEWIKVNNAWNEKVTKIYREPLVTKLYAKKEFQHAEASKIEGLVKEIEINN